MINRTYLLDSIPGENTWYRVGPVKLPPGNRQRIRLTVLARKIREAAERDDVARELQRRKNLTVLIVDKDNTTKLPSGERNLCS